MTPQYINVNAYCTGNTGVMYCRGDTVVIYCRGDTVVMYCTGDTVVMYYTGDTVAMYCRGDTLPQHVLHTPMYFTNILYKHMVMVKHMNNCPCRSAP